MVQEKDGDGGVSDSRVTMEGRTDRQTEKKPCLNISSSFSPTGVAIRTKLFYLEEVTCGA